MLCGSAGFVILTGFQPYTNILGLVIVQNLTL